MAAAKAGAKPPPKKEESLPETILHFAEGPFGPGTEGEKELNEAPGKTAKAVTGAASGVGSEIATGVTEAAKPVGEFIEKVLVNGALLLAGLFLIVYGVMVAVRPADRATSLPVP